MGVFGCLWNPGGWGSAADQQIPAAPAIDAEADGAAALVQFDLGIGIIALRQQAQVQGGGGLFGLEHQGVDTCLLYTSDAADD